MNVLLLVSDALGAILFLFCAVLSIRLLLMYEGGALRETMAANLPRSHFPRLEPTSYSNRYASEFNLAWFRSSS
jgi:hypothetical protein